MDSSIYFAHYSNIGQTRFSIGSCISDTLRSSHSLPQKGKGTLLNLLVNNCHICRNKCHYNCLQFYLKWPGRTCFRAHYIYSAQKNNYKFEYFHVNSCLFTSLIVRTELWVAESNIRYWSLYAFSFKSQKRSLLNFTVQNPRSTRTKFQR